MPHAAASGLALDLSQNRNYKYTLPGPADDKVTCVTNLKSPH